MEEDAATVFDEASLAVVKGLVLVDLGKMVS